MAETGSRHSGDATLHGRTALVCGSSGMIGSAVARALAEAGARVALHYHRNVDAAEKLRSELSALTAALAVRADLSDDDEADDLFRRLERELSAPDIVANCSYIHAPRKLAADLEWSDWQPHIASLRAHHAVCSRAVVPMRRKRHGRIIYVSGALAVRYYPGCSAYSAVKAAAEAYCRTLALEEGKSNITVNIISPGLVLETSSSDRVVEEYEELDWMSRQRMALPTEPTCTDIAQAIVFLAGPSAGGITGQALFLTGGEIMR